MSDQSARHQAHHTPDTTTALTAGRTARPATGPNPHKENPP
ncbi:hypothetical protein ACWD04_32830 [Streptomyces sp. NPDC002911]